MKIERIPQHSPVKKINETLSGELSFGKIFTDNMFIMKWTIDKGWHYAAIQPHHYMQMSPAAKMLHYAQGGFEGLKAYSRGPGKFALFRHEDNIKRFNRTAQRLCMPDVDPKDFEEALIELIKTDISWIPQKEGQSLYIRPTIISTESEILVKEAAEYQFFIILSPVGAYFKNGLNPSRIYVEEKMSRVPNGGMGDVKAAANYAGSLKAAQNARKNNCAQVLWLDASDHRFVEEVGAMNIFFVHEDKTLLTPRLNGNILPGITRNSIIKLAEIIGMNVVEAYFDISDIVQDIRKGNITEIFGTGTAAVVAPVNELFYRGKNRSLKNKETGPVTKKLYQLLTDIQYKHDFHNINDSQIRNWIKEFEI